MTMNLQKNYEENIEERNQQQPENEVEREFIAKAMEIHGEEKAIELFDKIKAEAFAETILSNEKYLYAGSYDKHRKKKSKI